MLRLVLSCLLVAATESFSPAWADTRSTRGHDAAAAANSFARRLIHSPQMTIGGSMGGLFRRLIGSTADQDDPDAQADTPAESLEYVPLVLVVGAAGRTGRIIVRKLVLKGFRVAVLVRSLSTDTLNLLGSGVSYSYGDMTDYRSLLDAMEDVDRVIFAAESDSELDGLKQVVRSFQDTRTFMYGDAEATKLTLLKMRRDADFNRWAVEGTSEDIAGRLAAAGIGPTPCVAYWKRSPTGAHRNGVFVGKVFDTFLGSAAVSCSLSGLLVGGNAPVLPPSVVSDSIGLPASSVAEQSGEFSQREGDVAGGVVKEQRDQEAASAAAASTAAGLDRAAAAMAATEVPLDLGEYSGLLVRAIGDGKSYTVVCRTREYAQSGIEYHADFKSQSASFATVRLPFSSFVAVRNGRPVQDGPELNRRQLIGLALAFYPQRNNPSQTTGEFYLSIANIKTYRKRDEPEIVYISDAGVAELPRSVVKQVGANGKATAADDADRRKRLLAKQRAEALLRASGLTYFIVRPVELDDRPQSSRKLTFTQGDARAEGSVSRADIAEVAVSSLLDPRACNVACTISESTTVAPSSFEQDISKALEVLEPNRL